MKRLTILLALFIGILAPLSAQAGSKFYLTVEKSFGPSDQPKVRLDFQSKLEPIVLRVLKPKNIDSFLEGQLNISRSYEEPLSKINAGHYLARGINKVRSPLFLLRDALSVEFRTGFGQNAFSTSLKTPPNGDLISTPDEITSAAPKDFEIVREIVLDLQKGEAAPPGLYGDFGFWEGYSYNVKDIILDPLPPGVYLLEGLQGKAEGQALLQVSNLSVQAKQSPQELLVRVIDRNLAPVKGSKLSFRDGRGKWIQANDASNDSGELYFKSAEGTLDSKLLLKVTAPSGEVALVNTEFLPTSVKDESVYLVTDRPLFRPGDSFFYKGTIRQTGGGAVTMPAELPGQARVKLLTAAGVETGLEQNVSVSPYGTFDGTFELSEYFKPGLYKVAADVKEKTFAGDLRIKDYVKPTFYLELIKRDDVLSPGAPFSFSFKAKKFSGGVPQKARYEVFLYRQKFQVPEWLQESAGALHAETDYFGQIKDVSPLSTPQRMYSSVEDRRVQGGSDFDTEDPWASASYINDDGSAEVTIEIPKVTDRDMQQDWVYSLVVRCLGSDGTYSFLSENIPGSAILAAAKVGFDQPFSNLSDKKAKLHVLSVLPNGLPAAHAAGEIHSYFESAKEPKATLTNVNFETDEHGIATVEMPLPERPGVIHSTAVIKSLEKVALLRASESPETSTIVSGIEGDEISAEESIRLVADKSVLAPGEQAKVLAILPNSNANQNSRAIWYTLAGDHIFEHDKKVAIGGSTWFTVTAKPEYGNGFYFSAALPNASGKYREQTVGFRIVPKDKLLTLDIKPEKDSGEPLKPFQIALHAKDFQGSAAAKTEISVAIVDKAVLSLQPELRPSIVDFFYPLQRLNLASFYSDDLQGYGYADELKRPNFSFAALKSSTKPTKKNLRDTAGWFPHVITDVNGDASITVQMPANITEWIVTAVGMDLGGRVGEGKGAFRTSTDISIDLLAPSFMRRGDEATAALSLSNQAKETAKIDANISGNMILIGNKTSNSVSVPSQKQQNIDLKLAAISDKPKAEISADIKAGGALRSGGVEQFEIKMLPSAFDQRLSIATSESVLPFAVPSNGVPSHVSISVTNGILGAALNAASQLTTYPYGCTEQLVDTTIPNLALMSLIEKAELSEDQLKTLKLDKAILSAKANAELAVKKLAANQKTDGGFGLWPSDQQPTFALTALANRTLQLASSLQVEGAAAMSRKAESWLRTHADEFTFNANNLLDVYTLQNIAAGEVYSKFDATYADLIKTVAKQTKSASLPLLTAALDIVTKNSSHYWFQSQLGKNTFERDFSAEVAKRLLASDPRFGIQQISQDFEPMGFGMGQDALLARAIGALNAAKKLPASLETAVTEKLAHGLRGGIWRSTLETAEVILSLKDILQNEISASKSNSGDQRVIEVMLNGKSIGKLSPGIGNFSGDLALPSTPEGLFDLSLKGATQKDFVNAALHVSVENDKVEPLESGIALQRNLYKVGPNSAKLLDRNAPLKKGDIIVSEVKLIRSQANYEHGLPSRFIVLQDPVPSFAEAIEEDKQYITDSKLVASPESYFGKIADTIRYQDRTERVLDLKAGETFTVLQVWRVRFDGKGVLPPATAFDMYDEELSGNTEGLVIATN